MALGVGDDTPITERPSGSRNGAIEHRVGVRVSIGNGPVDLDSAAVVEVSGDWAADEGDADKQTVVGCDTVTPQVTDWRLGMMAMPRPVEGAGVSPADRNEL